MVYALLLDGADDKARRRLDASIEQAAQSYRIEAERAHAAAHPEAPPTWWRNEQAAAADALAMHKRFQLLQGGGGDAS